MIAAVLILQVNLSDLFSHEYYSSSSYRSGFLSSGICLTVLSILDLFSVVAMHRKSSTRLMQFALLCTTSQSEFTYILVEQVVKSKQW